MVGDPDVQTKQTTKQHGYLTESTNPGQLLAHSLHVRIEEISTLLAGSTRVTRQGGLTRLNYCFHLNAYKHLTAKELPAASIQPGVKSNPGTCKEGLICLLCALPPVLKIVLICCTKLNSCLLPETYFHNLN